MCGVIAVHAPGAEQSRSYGPGPIQARGLKVENWLA